MDGWPAGWLKVQWVGLMTLEVQTVICTDTGKDREVLTYVSAYQQQFHISNL